MANDSDRANRTPEGNGKSVRRGRRAATAVAPGSSPPPQGAGLTADTLTHPSRPPTINDVARLSGVSKKTVSRVINQSPFVNEETRAQINAIIERIGYVPSPQARGLAFHRSFLLGLVYDNPNAQYIVNVQAGILEACRGAGYELVVHPCQQSSPHFLSDVKQFVQRQKLDGVILVPPVSEDAALVDLLREAGCRYVRLASVALDDADSMLIHNDRLGAAEVADYLIQLGHRDIGFITGPQRYRSTHERREGFLGALAKRGITLAEGRVREGEYSFESGESRGMQLLVGPDRPTAIFASNDEMAAGVYKAAYRLGIPIPAALTVVGFDDSPLASRLCPALSTVRLPIREMGRLAADKLIARIAHGDTGPAGAKAAGVDPHLVVRESSAPPAAL